MPPPSVLKLALPVPLPRLFDYLPPAGIPVADVAPGHRVRVDFGKRELVAVVERIGAAEYEHDDKLKAALSLLDKTPVLQGELLDNLRWLSRYTHAPLGEVFATALPAALRRGEALPDTRTLGWRLNETGHTALPGLRKGARPRALAELLRGQALDEDALAMAMDDWRTPMRALAKRGLVEQVEVAASESHAVAQPGPAPNDEQAAAIEAIRASEGFAAHLLDGVTGSGKTEVYLHAIADCLARGKQALVLVPEIGLTPQLLSRFRKRLGIPVHVSHSGLNDNERAHAWAAAVRGEARVIVGTRSAVFTPLPEAGLIVIDEEHDASYKQQDGIRYHARDFALVRGKSLGVPVVLGSATPSLESLQNAITGRYQHPRLTSRAGGASPPRVRVHDVRKRPLDAGLSSDMLQSIQAAVASGGQVLVFRNRRGYAPILLCHDCGWSAQCTRCSTAERGSPMTVHGAGRRLQCHHCGARRPGPMACPDCASLALQAQGAGTERIEQWLAERFTEVPVLRIDSASTRRKDGFAKALAKLGDAPGILIGTQMLAKGHDLPNLTLVCVVGVDEGLFSADFRAPEKLAQLLVQVAGRAGRAGKPGEVLLQTHHPDHPLLSTLIAGGYHAFAEGALAEREAAELPPFAYMALLRAEAKHADAPRAFLQAARDLLASTETDSDVAIDGPLPAPMPRRGGMHRAQLLLTATTRAALHAALDATTASLYALPEARKVRWSLDVDPADLY